MSHKHKRQRPGRTGRAGAVFLFLILALLPAACGSEPDPPAKKPEPEPEPVTKYLGWYDVGHPSAQFAHLDKARRSSNLMYMRVRFDEFTHLIPRALANGFKSVILGGDEENIPRTAAAARAIVGSGLNLVGIIYADEPDLGPPLIQNRNMTQRLTHLYQALKAELAKVGLEKVPIGANWSLAAPEPWTWRKRLDAYGVPPQDMYVTDSWYTGRENELHLVRHRAIEWLDYMFQKSGPKPIIHVLKAFSRVPPDVHQINPEWVLSQLRCVVGTGSSSYNWQNPQTGDRAAVQVAPLPREYRGLAVLLYKMDPTRNADTSEAGGNRPDIIEAVAQFAKPLGLTVE